MASAVRFDIDKARQEEWDRYEAYRADYIQYHDLEEYSDYVSDFNLAQNFGFYGPDHYYISPQVWNAKYNPPLQGESYCTSARGCGNSLQHPSAVQYYGEQMNGRYVGAVPSTWNDRMFDHPDMYGYGYQAGAYPAYGYQGGQYGGYAGGYAGGYGYQFEGLYSENPAFYARISESMGNGFYVVGFY